MERLTKYDVDIGYYVYEGLINDQARNYLSGDIVYMGDAIDLLAEYEDTGLSPAEVASLQSRLSHYEKAEQEGRLVELPCKVGDTVYVVTKCENVWVRRDDEYFTGTGATECPFEKDCKFDECDDGNVRVFETTIRGVWMEDNHICAFCDTLNYEIIPSDFGKTVFLTEPEAIKALEGDKP